MIPIRCGRPGSVSEHLTRIVIERADSEGIVGVAVDGGEEGFGGDVGKEGGRAEREELLVGSEVCLEVFGCGVWLGS